MQVTIHVNNLDPTIAKLDRLPILIKGSMKPALETIGALGSKYFGGVAFQSKGSMFGKPWAPLAASTLKEKTKAGYRGYPDMVRTKTILDGFDSKLNDTATNVTLFNKAPWFVYHQSAEDRKRLPRRVMIGVNASLKTMIRTTVTKAVDAAVLEAIK